MEYRFLGPSLVKVSVLSYGGWLNFGRNVDVEQAKILLQSCRDNGVNFFDNVHLYVNVVPEKLEEYRSVHEKYGIGLATYSPLDNGVLTGKHNERIPRGSRLTLDPFKFSRIAPFPPDLVKKLDMFKSIADGLEATMAQVAIAWCAASSSSVSTVMTGASSVLQLEDNMKAVGIISKLTPQVMERIEDIFK